MPVDQPDASCPTRTTSTWPPAGPSRRSPVSLGVNNVLDDNPSISGAVGTSGNGNTYPQAYDALGRFVFLATVDF